MYSMAPNTRHAVNGGAGGAAAEWAPRTFLAGLTATATAELLALGVRRRLPAGRVMIREGEHNTHVEILLSGFVKATTVVAGVESVLSIRLPGDIFGEMGALTGQPRTATVTACGPVVSCVISRADFHGYLRRHPEAAIGVAAAVAEQLRWANRRRTDSAAYPAHVRLARLLAEIADACGRPTEHGIEIGVTLSQMELAAMIGIAEVTVQKAMHYLRAAGLIRTGYRRLTIVDLDALRSVGE